MKAVRAFTRVELLVVIAIIVLNFAVSESILEKSLP